MFQRIKIREVSVRKRVDESDTTITYACDECGDLYTVTVKEFGRRLLTSVNLGAPQLCETYAAMCHRTLQYPFFSALHLHRACMGMRCEYCRKEEASRARGPYNPHDWVCSDCGGDD